MPYAMAPQTLTETQKAEAVVQIVGIPFESTNKYKVHLMPPNKVVKNQSEHPDGWETTATELDSFLFAHEESVCFTRIFMMSLGCGNLRPLQMQMHIAVRGSTGNAHKREHFSPYFGQCMSACCLATAYTDIERALPSGTYEKKYSLEVRSVAKKFRPQNVTLKGSPPTSKPACLSSSPLVFCELQR